MNTKSAMKTPNTTLPRETADLVLEKTRTDWFLPSTNVHIPIETTKDGRVWVDGKEVEVIKKEQS